MGRKAMGAPAAHLLTESPRRFPPPWTTDDNGACFVVRDGDGQALAYVFRIIARARVGY